MIVDSRLKTGHLKFGVDTGTPPIVFDQDFSCQPTNVTLTPTANEEGDPVEVLCGDSLPAATTTAWALTGTSIQDFDDPDGFVAWAMEHDLEDMAFEWRPNATGPTYTGTVQVRAVVIGGDVGTRNTSDFEWPVNGKPTPTYTP